jgi:hypothetical protein
VTYGAISAVIWHVQVWFEHVACCCVVLQLSLTAHEPPTRGSHSSALFAQNVHCMPVNTHGNYMRPTVGRE